MKVLFSRECLEFRQPHHAESPERVETTIEFLRRKEVEIIEPDFCTKEDLLLVHENEYVERVKNGTLDDIDTPDLPRIYDYARLSAGSAIKAMEIALARENTFSLMRPPGHHAGIRGPALGVPSLGFCYFNNIAIACKTALELDNARKIALVDIDCHHGNGTQEIFLGDKNVLFISLHRYGSFYPGTGRTSKQNCLNYPLRFGVTEESIFQF